MNLDELVDKYPHGSRWRRPANNLRPEMLLTVVGWHEPQNVVWRRSDDGCVFTTPAHTMVAFKREALCPITEPVTLGLTYMSPPFWCAVDKSRMPTNPNGPLITLLPDGRYTWEGGPE